MKVEGMTLHEWWEKAPFGAFAKAVREKLDPEWGLPVTITDFQEWEVSVDYSYSGRGTEYIAVKARDEKEAKELALKEFDKREDSLDFSEAEVTDAEVRDGQLTK